MLRLRTHRSFSLIELIIVIAVILLIAGMLLPVLAKSRERAKQSRWEGFSRDKRMDGGLVAYYDFNSPELDVLQNVAVGPDSASNYNPSNLDGTFQGTWLSRDGRWNSYAAVFTGSEYIDCGNDSNLNITNAITVEAWAKPVAGSPTGHLVNRGGGYTTSGYSLYWYAGDLRVELQNDSEKTFYDNTVVDDGKWHHFAFTWDIEHGQVQPYFDGKPLPIVQTFNGPIGTPGQPLNIGRDAINGRYFQGVIDDAAVYNRALSAQEIADTYRIGQY